MARPTSLTIAELWHYALDPAPYAAAGAPPWLDELDFKVAPPHNKMGTHSLDADSFLEVDQFADAEIGLRRRLLDEQHDVVFGALPSADDAARETLELVTDWLERHGRPAPPAAVSVHPLERAASAVQEDLCLMVQRDGDWHFDAGAVLFPTIWRLCDKLGGSTAAIHGPVHGYVDELSSRVDGFFNGLRPGRVVWRRNLSIKPFHLLHVPVDKVAQPVGELRVEADGSPFWLRTERQTLQRLARSGAILFTIKVQIAPAGVLLSRPDRVRDLLAMYGSWDDGMSAYKIAANKLDVSFIPWLQRIVGDDAPSVSPAIKYDNYSTDEEAMSVVTIRLRSRRSSTKQTDGSPPPLPDSASH